jgi:FkbM family methyltransferase
MRKLTYAQNAEDVLLHRAFPTGTGFYIDVGACHPVLHSVTKHFYERGWRGINIEPVARVHEMLCADRPRDINLNMGLSNRDDTLTFYEATTSLGWSTFRAEHAEGVRQIGIDFVERSVPVTTLAAVCERYVDQPIDFLKVDVEGHEREVLEGADWSRWRPRVVLIEGLDPSPWEDLVLGSGYLYATFDGINRFYVREEDHALLSVLSVPANSTDGFEPFEHHELVEALREQLASAQAALSDLSSRCEALSAQLERLGSGGAARRFPRLASAVHRWLRPVA